MVANDLLTLQALNAARLKEAGAVNADFVSRTINDAPLNPGGDLVERLCGRQPAQRYRRESRRQCVYR